MKNRYLFFNAENFEGLDLGDYTKEDTQIPKTDVHIYTFSYASTDESTDDELRAKKLDELTQLITQKYEEKFQVVDSESSQYFCRELYPYIQSFETRLRYALYIARSLYDPQNLNNKSFLLCVTTNNKKENLPLEALDFSQIYTAVFTDAKLQAEANKKYDTQLTKAEWIKRIESITEKTLWHDWVGCQYNFIEDNFLDIKNIRNDVMHSHLISYQHYSQAKKTLQKAIEEIEQVIHDKLITNTSEYATKINLFESISGLAKMAEKTAELIGAAFANYNSAEVMANMSRALALIAKAALTPTELPNKALPEENDSETCEDENSTPQDSDSTHDEEE